MARTTTARSTGAQSTAHTNGHTQAAISSWPPPYDELPPEERRSLRTMPMGVIQWTSRFTVSDWNDEAEHIFGYSRHEAMGRHAAGFIVRGSRQDVKKAWQDRKRRRMREISEAITKDGRSILCEWWSAPVDSDSSQPSGVLCFVQDVTERERTLSKLKAHEHLLRAVTSNVPVVLWAVDAQGIFTYQDGKGLEGAGLKPRQFIGLNIFELYAGDPEAVQDIRRAMAGETIHFQSEHHGVSWDSWLIPVTSGDKVNSVIGLTLDVTELKRVETELRGKIDVIERQQQVIRDLSTPVLQIWDGVLALPLVGMIDSSRVAEVTDNLLSRIVQTGARHAILDLTGIDTIDTSAANHLWMVIRSIRLVGAQAVITGIRPTVAQTMVSLGVDFGDIVTLATLRDGLKHCIKRAAQAA